MRYKESLLGKRIAVIGIGPEGEMLQDIKFLVKSNALVSVYDLRSEARLLEETTALRSFGLANLVMGQVPPDDLLDMDLILLSHEYPRDSSFLAGVRAKGIDIEYPETLFLKLAPPITVIGIMGACGKSTVLSMLAPMLEARSSSNNAACVIVDPESGGGVVSHLKKLTTGDVAVMKILPQMMSEICALNWSPQIAVFTTIPLISSYRESPFEIMANQTYNNYVIGSDDIIDAVRTSGFQTKAKLLRTKASIVPEDWLPEDVRAHDRDNAALAVQAARILKVDDNAIQSALVAWKPLKGRSEQLKKVRGIDIVNDSASVVPMSTISCLSSIPGERNAIVIFGGADHGVDCRELYASLKKRAKSLIVIPGSGTLRERPFLQRLDGIPVSSAPSVEEAVRMAMDQARKGDVVVYSPAFAVGGFDSSRKERSERFMRAVRSI